MAEVSFGQYSFRTEKREQGEFIFDIARKKFVALTSEEWVRQHILHYMVNTLNYPLNHIAVERGIELNGLQKRFDIVVFATSGNPVMIVECKAPEEELNEKVFEQIARYNLSLKVNYLWVTNGTRNFCCALRDGIRLLERVPAYGEIK